MKKITLNNFKISTKLILIYVFCVLIPMLATNVVVISTIYESARKEQQSQLVRQMESVKYNLKSAVDSCLTVSIVMYTDRNLYRFLNTGFSTPIEYYNDYYNLLQNNMVRYFYSLPVVNKVTIYANNKSITNSAHLYRIDSIENEQWYQEFNESGKSMISYVYYDESKKYSLSKDSARTISIIRALDYFSGLEKIVKIDLDYNKLLSDLNNIQVNGEVYVCNDDYILFTNRETGAGYKPFEPADDFDVSKATITSELTVLSQKWHIYIVPDNVKLWSSLSGSGWIIAILVVVNLLLPTFVIALVEKSLRARIALTATYLNKVKKEEFEIIDCEPGEDEIGQLIQDYNRMVIQIKELIEVVLKGKAEKRELELARKQAELKALQSQVNPHFMFNTLESIRMRSLIKNEIETSNIIGELAILMRRSIDWGNDEIPIGDEIAFAESYLNLQKYRFGDKLSFSLQISDDCKHYKIPKLTIVTFVENACVHGIEGVSHNGTVSVTVTKDIRNLFIEVSDTGCGMGDEKLEKITNMLSNANIDMLNDSESTGLLNAFIRLKSFCNGNLYFEIFSQADKGTDITVQIPIEILESKKVEREEGGHHDD